MANRAIKDLQVEDVMSKVPITATEEENLSEALAKLKKHDLQELPVVRKNRLVGLVSYETLIKRRNLPLSTKVGHIMSTPPKLSNNAPLTVAAEMLISSGFRALPITSRGKKLVGMVSRKDLLKGIAQNRDLAIMEISSIMTKKPQCVNENDNITRARTAMRNLSVRTLPVINDNERLVGVITVKDIAKIWTPKTKESAGEKKGEKISLDVEVKSVMNPNPVYVGKEGKVEEVIGLMQKYDISNILVAEGEKPVGIITSLDLIELIARTKERESLYVQITGLDEEDAEYYDDMYELIHKYMSKINRFEKMRLFTLHVVQYHDKSFVKEYEMRARLSTDKQMFYAQGEGWDLMKVLDEVLEAFERMVTKEKEKRVDAIKKKSGF
ncbi:MAG: CBS domain-containing protein [Thermoplasmata archaeon]|nr:MAG: CBS domain-containing protein [Thermoplasmata archaeon]